MLIIFRQGSVGRVVGFNNITERSRIHHTYSYNKGVVNKMSNKDKSNIFEKTFGELLENNKEENDAVIYQSRDKLQEVLLRAEGKKSYRMKIGKNQLRGIFLLPLKMKSWKSL
ncbi:hypothetical protein AAHB59_13120 [Bacillus cereus]